MEQKGSKAVSWQIPIKYIDQAEGENRPRGLEGHHVRALAKMMYWQPNVGAGSPALLCVQPNPEDETSTNKDLFVWEDIEKGRYRYI